jgi:predicted transposase/invertase (TIGR01784 family)
MANYLDPKNDLLFKKIFGEHKELLISFLNSFLPLGEKEIVEIEYLSPEQVPDTPLGKNSIVDVRCTDNNNRVFIVEMQMEWSNMFRKRLLVNGAKAIIKQLEKKSFKDKAKKFSELEPVYVLAVINGAFSDGIEWRHHLQIVSPNNPAVIIEGLDYILLELPKFKRETWTLAEKKMAILWLRFLKEIEGNLSTLPKELEEDKLISTAIEMCKESALTPEERYIYDRCQENMLWEASIKDLEDEVSESRKTIEDKDKTIEEKEKTIEEKEKELAREKESSAKKDEEMAKKDEEMAKKDAFIAKLLAEKGMI